MVVPLVFLTRAPSTSYQYCSSRSPLLFARCQVSSRWSRQRANLHLRQPVLIVPHQRLLAGQPLVAHGHVAVGVVVEAVGAADAVDRVVGAGVAVAVDLAVEGGQAAGAVVAVGAGEPSQPVVREAVAGRAFAY